MKSYPFARLYLALLTAMGLIMLALSVLVVVTRIPEYLSARANVKHLREKPVAVDVHALAIEIQTALNAIRTTGSLVLPEVKKPSEFGIDASGAIKGRDLKHVAQLISSYRSAILQAKDSMLHDFNQQIDVLIAAARSALAEASLHRQPETATIRRAQVYDKASLAYDSRERLDDAQRFLDSGIRSYTPSSNAHATAAAASRNLQAAKRIYETDLAHLRSMESILRRERTMPLPEQPQLDLLLEFIRRLNEVKSEVQTILLNNWQAEFALSRVEQRVQDRLDRIAELRGEVRAMGLGMLWNFARLVVAGVLLLILRDFLSAAIDTAKNTQAISKSLESSQIEVEDT